jgi:hypothetical protein
MSAPFDEDALIACVELVGRTGATKFEIGYLNDEDDPCFAKHGAQWWAHAEYRGQRIISEDHPGPVEAADGLARKLLTGAKCKCGALVSLSDDGAVFTSGRMVDGSTWTAEEAEAAGQCRWSRHGRHWRRGCEPEVDVDTTPHLDRAERRRRARADSKAALRAERRGGGA